jgi:hypothetical protein
VPAKQPSVQNSPPHSRFLASGQRRKISRAVRLLMIVTSLATLQVGTDRTRKWT